MARPSGCLTSSTRLSSRSGDGSSATGHDHQGGTRLAARRVAGLPDGPRPCRGAPGSAGCCQLGRAGCAVAAGAVGAGGVRLPVDLPTYNAAAGRVDLTSNRRVNIVDLSELGRDGFAVVAMIPEVGPVGAQVGTDGLAAAIRDHFLTQPAADLLPWKVTEMPPGALGPDDAGAVDLVATVRGLDPSTNRDRAVARHLRGHGPQVDAAIAERFAGVDLEAPLTVQPPAPGRTPPTSDPGPAAAARSGQRAADPSAPATAADAARAASGTPPARASRRPRPWPRRTPRPRPPDASGGPPAPAP